MTISVIIPVYNEPTGLMHAVDSALAQTLAPTEILIVDDHSTDNTPEVARTLAATHREVRFCEVPKGRDGVSAARNVGLSQARGDLITFLDADDALEPTMLEVLTGLLEETGADVVGCDFRDGDGQNVTYHSKRFLQQAMLIEHDTRVWSKLYTRKAIDGITFPEDMTIGEDMLFLVGIMARQDLVYVLTHQRLYDYTINPQGAMERRFAPSYMDQIRCWDRAEELVGGTLDADMLLRLRAVQVVSAVLVGSKIAALPGSERAQYNTEWVTARASLRRYLEDRGCLPYLPHGYRTKSRLMNRFPHLFVLFCKKRYAHE